MGAYVKICPRCGHRNDELASACERDAEFLGMVPAIPLRDAPPEKEPTAPSAPQSSPAAAMANAIDLEHGDSDVAAMPEAAALPGKALYLDLEGGAQYYSIRDGWVVGQSHPSSAADVQLSGIPGSNYVHRRHCVFEFRDDDWHVKPLEQPEYTNPTFVNDTRLTPGESVRLRNGDKLRLSGVMLRIRIIDL